MVAILDQHNKLIDNYYTLIGKSVFTLGCIESIIKSLIARFCTDFKFTIFPQMNIDHNKIFLSFVNEVKRYYNKNIVKNNYKNEQQKTNLKLEFTKLYVEPIYSSSPKLEINYLSNTKFYVLINKLTDTFFITDTAILFNSDIIYTKNVLCSIASLILKDGKFPQKIIKNYLDSIVYNMICEFCDKRGQNYPQKNSIYYEFIENSLIYLFNGGEIS